MEQIGQVIKRLPLQRESGGIDPQRTSEESGEQIVDPQQERVRRLAVYSGLPPVTRETMRFSTWTDRGNQSLAEALEAAKEYAEGNLEQKLFTLSGAVGSGKTHLAMAIAWEWLERGQIVKFYEVPRLLDAMRHCYEETELAKKWETRLPPLTIEDFIGQLERCELLILDDLGEQRTTEWAEERLDLVVNHRWLNDLPLIVTTNAKREDLPPRIADRIGDVHKARIVQIDATSFRRAE